MRSATIFVLSLLLIFINIINNNALAIANTELENIRCNGEKKIKDYFSEESSFSIDKKRPRKIVRFKAGNELASKVK